MFIETNIGINNQKNRELWLERTLKKIPKGSLILDVGAGEQQYRKFCSHLKYESQDFAKYDGKGNGKGLQMVKWNYGELDIVSDITKIPKPKETYDAIMCVEVFEHIPNPIAAIKEFSRLMKPGGYLIITAPFCSLTHFSPYHFYSGFNSYFYDKYLKESGFKIKEMVANGNYFDYIAQEIGRCIYVADTYSHFKPALWLKVLFKVLGIGMFFLLKQFSDGDSNSSTILCFGYQVLARKQYAKD